MSIEVKNISNQIFNLTREDGIKLDNIIKKQEKHLDVVDNNINFIQFKSSNRNF